MHSSRVPESSSTATATATATATNISVSTSIVSQPEPAAGQRQQGSFVGLSTTAHTPESTRISPNYYQQDELRLLSDISTSASQTDPLEALTTYIAITFDDDDQRQSASSLSLSNEPSRSQKSSQSVDDSYPIVREEQNPDPTNKWIIMSGDEKKPFQCGYKRCGRKYSKKETLQIHFVTHAGDSKLRCYQGDCAGTVIYRDAQALTRHMHTHHTFERAFGCKLCDRRFRQQHHLSYHMEHVHLIKSKKKSPKQHSFFESFSATTTTHTSSTSTMTSWVSQPESAARQCQQGSFVDLSKTVVYTPESTHIPVTEHQLTELRLLAEITTSQIEVDPFEALAAHQTATLDDEAVPTGIAGFPSLPSDQHLAEQSRDPTDEWIIVEKSQERPYKCGYTGCDKSYKYKHHLREHFTVHTGKSKYKCNLPGCDGRMFCDSSSLSRHTLSIHSTERPFQCDRCNRRFARKYTLKNHRKRMHDRYIHIQHSFEKPFECETCNRRFARKDNLKYHREHVHSLENEQKSPKRKRK